MFEVVLLCGRFAPSVFNFITCCGPEESLHLTTLHTVLFLWCQVLVLLLSPVSSRLYLSVYCITCDPTSVSGRYFGIKHLCIITHIKDWVSF